MPWNKTRHSNTRGSDLLQRAARARAWITDVPTCHQSQGHQTAMSSSRKRRHHEPGFFLVNLFGVDFLGTPRSESRRKTKPEEGTENQENAARSHRHRKATKLEKHHEAKHPHSKEAMTQSQKENEDGQRLQDRGVAQVKAEAPQAPTKKCEKWLTAARCPSCLMCPGRPLFSFNGCRLIHSTLLLLSQPDSRIDTTKCNVTSLTHNALHSSGFLFDMLGRQHRIAVVPAKSPS